MNIQYESLYVALGKCQHLWNIFWNILVELYENGRYYLIVNKKTQGEMALINQEDALESLGDRLYGIYDTVAGAFSDYMSEYSERSRLIHTPRSRASLIHDHMVDRAYKLAASDGGILVREVQGLHVLVVDSIGIRFKKFDEDLHTSNQFSTQVLRFKSQFTLPGIDAAHHLEAGYVLSEDGQRLHGVHLVCPSGVRTLKWGIVLTDDDERSPVEDLFDKQNQTHVEEEGAKVRRKRSATVITLKKRDGSNN